MQTITLLGATGSIGDSTLDVIRAHPDRYQLHALTAHRNIEKLYELIVLFRPKFAVVATKQSALALADRTRLISPETQVLYGPEALVEVAAHPDADTCVSAIVGAAGLAPTLAAAKAGKQILLANKESLVMAGALIWEAIDKSGATLLPLDSEHNAIFQCLQLNNGFRQPEQIGANRIVLTASGGPFRNTSSEKLPAVTPEQACDHPKWSMGQKISVDSATMMNKGLEVIEAHWLFGFCADKIEVVIHPESIVHSFVGFEDGSMLAQVSQPDMRVPIAHALAWPDRIPSGVPLLDMTKVGQLNFEPVDEQRFPCLALAFEALRQGSGAMIALNAANEEAVAAFLAERIRFTDIPSVVETALASFSVTTSDDLDQVFEIDIAAREKAKAFLAKTNATYQVVN